MSICASTSVGYVVGASVTYARVYNHSTSDGYYSLYDGYCIRPIADSTPTTTYSDSKADKVESATNGNFAALDATGNLVDSGHKHSDYLTSHQDISGKENKLSVVT